MRSRPTYLLVNGLGALLIAALIGTPLWDFWHYRGTRATPGPVRPLGVILPPAQRPHPGTPGAAPEPAAASREPATAPWPRAEELARWLSLASAAPAGAGAPAGAFARSGTGTDRTAGAPAAPGRDEAAMNQSSPEAGGPDRAPTMMAGFQMANAARTGSRSADVETGVGTPAPPSADAPSPETPALAWVPLTQDLAPRQPMPQLQEPPDGEPPPAPSRLPTPPRTPGDPAATAAIVPDVVLFPHRTQLAVGDTLAVTVVLRGAAEITSLPFHVMFDAGVLEYTGSEAGPALGNTLKPVLLASVSPNRPGDLAVGLSLIESSGSFSGSGGVVVLTFKAIGPGSSGLDFSRATLRGATSEPLQTHFHNTAVTVR